MARKLPWFKFFSADWQNDPNLRACSLNARGLWLELCLILPETESPGYLIINGVKPDPTTIASLVGTADVQAVENGLLELASKGVPGFTEDGVLYSRRIINELNKASGNAVRCKRYRDRQKSRPANTPTESQRASDATWSRMSPQHGQHAPTENNTRQNSGNDNDLTQTTREQHGRESESESEYIPPYPLSGGDMVGEEPGNPLLQRAWGIIRRLGIINAGVRQQTIVCEMIAGHGEQATEDAIRAAMARRVALPINYAAGILTNGAVQAANPQPAQMTRTQQNLERSREMIERL